MGRPVVLLLAVNLMAAVLADGYAGPGSYMHINTFTDADCSTYQSTYYYIYISAIAPNQNDGKWANCIMYLMSAYPGSGAPQMPMSVFSFTSPNTLQYFHNEDTQCTGAPTSTSENDFTTNVLSSVNSGQCVAYDGMYFRAQNQGVRTDATSEHTGGTSPPYFFQTGHPEGALCSQSSDCASGLVCTCATGRRLFGAPPSDNSPPPCQDTCQLATRQRQRRQMFQFLSSGAKSPFKKLTSRSAHGSK